MLVKLGLDVEIADDGQLALLQLDRGEFDLILMDMHMPNMDGIEATKEIQLREQWKEIPIIAITANVLPQDIALCYSAGMDDHLGKPFTNGHLA